MPGALRLWLIAMLFCFPFIVVTDARARSAGISWRRRLVAATLALAASPLGAGLWIGLLHRSGRRTTSAR